MTKIVLFGAGASYGSGSVHPRPPPLGRELFAALRSLYASWRAIPEKEAALFEANFEEGMGRIIEQYGMAIAPLMQDMAVFFSVFSLNSSEANLYATLFRDLKNAHEVIWSTLNYECLLEFGAVSNGKKLGYFADPTSDCTVVPIWKLHGSCNFKIRGVEASPGVSFGTGVVFNGSIQVIEPSQVRAHFKGHTALYPAMALFAKDKPIAIAPDPIQEAQVRWRKHIAMAEKVAVVGVRPNPEDKHLWDSLSSCPGKVALICSENECSIWKAKYRPKLSTTCLGARWSESYGALIEFLEES